jgi:hypothetical protein
MRVYVDILEIGTDEARRNVGSGRMDMVGCMGRYVIGFVGLLRTSQTRKTCGYFNGNAFLKMRYA